MEKTLNKKQFLMIAGPMPLHPNVLSAMSTPIIGHRSRDFRNLFLETVSLAKKVFRTKKDVLILPCSGTGGLEAVVSNLMSPGDNIVVGLNGFFGNRFVDIMNAYGVECIPVDVDWGMPITLQDIIKTVDNYDRIKAVVIVHNETSTGVISDIADIAREVKKKDPNILVIVDAMSSLGGIDVRTDEWDLDVVVSASQKALMAPPGLCLMAISEAAWKTMEYTQLPRFYFNLQKIRQEGINGMTFTTPAVPIIFGLKKALQLLLNEGTENIFKRNLIMRDMLIDSITPLGFSLIANNKNYASTTVTALKLPHGIHSEEFRDHVEKRYSVLLAPGLGDLAQDCFRVGHMGYITPNDIIVTISAIKHSLNDFVLSGKG